MNRINNKSMLSILGTAGYPLWYPAHPSVSVRVSFQYTLCDRQFTQRPENEHISSFHKWLNIPRITFINKWMAIICIPSPENYNSRCFNISWSSVSFDALWLQRQSVEASSPKWFKVRTQLEFLSHYSILDSGL